MWRALTGEISRRKPLTVVACNDGKWAYCVFDGNNTYSSIIKRGMKNIPVVEVPRSYQKDITTLEQLYAIRYRDDIVESVSANYFIGSGCCGNYLTWTLETKPQP